MSTAAKLSHASIGRLLDIVSEKAEVDRLLTVLKEPRLDQREWADVLALELNALLRWGLVCVRQSVMAGDFETGDADEILCLLPHYGFALHAIRRALPFALLGRRVTVGVRPDKVSEAAEILSILADEVCGPDRLEVSNVEPSILACSFQQANLPICFTGSLETYQTLRKEYPSAKITAATGRCGVVICDDASSGDLIAKNRLRKTAIVSCSNHSTTILVDEFHCDSLVVLANGSAPARPTTVASLLAELHPSVIFGRATDGLPEELAGYSVIPCHEGVASRVEGFGRDPIGGWPGDYAIQDPTALVSLSVRTTTRQGARSAM